MKKQTKTESMVKGVGIFLVFVTVMITLILLVQFWLAVTEDVSAQGSCKIQQIDYIAMAGNGTSSCMFVLAEGEDIVVCGLPRDLDCDAGFTNLPLVRAMFEATR